MQITTIQGIVKNGQIQLTEQYELPESAEVYVIIPSATKRTARIMSPRLVDKSKLKDFTREISDIDENEI